MDIAGLSPHKDNGLREVRPPGSSTSITGMAGRACGQNLAGNWVLSLLRCDRTVSILFPASNTACFVCGLKCAYSSHRQKHSHGRFAQGSPKLSNSLNTSPILIFLRDIVHPDQSQRVSAPVSGFRGAHISQRLSQNLGEKEQEAQVVVMEPQEAGHFTVF